MNLIKNLPLMALVFGLGFTTIGAMSSFKGKRLSNLYYLDSAAGEWKLVTRTLDQVPDPVNGYEPNSYRCENSSSICTAEIESDEPVIDADTEPETFNESTGTYTPNN